MPAFAGVTATGGVAVSAPNTYSSYTGSFRVSFSGGHKGCPGRARA